jgi:hypothetical protein
MIGFIDTFFTITHNHNQLTIIQNNSSAELAQFWSGLMSLYSDLNYDWLELRLDSNLCLNCILTVWVTLPLTVYRQSVRFGHKLPETHDQ